MLLSATRKPDVKKIVNDKNKKSAVYFPKSLFRPLFLYHPKGALAHSPTAEDEYAYLFRIQTV